MTRHPGHDYNHNDGDGTSHGHPGSQGGKDNNDSHDGTKGAKGNKDKLSDDCHVGKSGGDQKTPGKTSYLSAQQLDKHCEDFVGGAKKETDTSAIVAHWIEVDLAVSRQTAMDDQSLSWLRYGGGADISGLHGASSGDFGSKSGCGVDTISLLAGSGSQLKTFRGLQEGMQRIA